MYGTHSWYGDTIGFWDGNKLVTTHEVSAAGRLHALVADDEQPIRSRSKRGSSRSTRAASSGSRCRSPSTIGYAFVKPVSAVYAFRRGKDLEAAGHRVQHWECETSNNDVFDKGTTTSRLPGEQGFKDARGTTLFPELPGQSRDPIYNTTLPAGEGVGDEDGVPVLPVALVASLLTASVAMAHHSFAMFDQQRRESRHRHGRALGSSMPRIRGSI